MSAFPRNVLMWALYLWLSKTLRHKWKLLTTTFVLWKLLIVYRWGEEQLYQETEEETNLLDIPRFDVSPVKNISSMYFNFLWYINARFIMGKKFSYVIGFLPILCKQLVNFFQGMVSSPKYIQAASHNLLTAEFVRPSIAFFSFVQLSSFHHKVLFYFLLVPITPWYLGLCPDLMSYQLLIPWGPTPNNQQPTSLGLSPSFASSVPHARPSPHVAWFIFSPPPSSSCITIVYGVIQEREEGKNGKVYMMNQQTKKNWVTRH